ncbi:MAG: acyltransferase [Campylobacterales bacterium]|nr:acyltransferase [Campylobacterales bacterium]
MTTNKLGNLEGLRGIAAISVVLFHFRLYFFPDTFPSSFTFEIENILNHLLSGFIDGGLAVYIFWIMSGYAISIGFFKRVGKEQEDYLIKAIEKRYFRLMLPVMVSVLLAWVLFTNDLFFHKEAITYLKLQNVSVLNTFYNFEPSFTNALKEGVFGAFFNYNGVESYNRVLWTMGPELFGSFIVFALLGVFNKHTLRWIFYIGLIVVFSLKIPPYAAFLVGLLFADFDLNKSALVPRFYIRYEKIIFTKTIIVFLLLPSALFFASHIYINGKIGSVVDLLAAAYITRLTFYNNHFSNLLSSKIGLFLGRISFGVYLVHVVVIVSFVSAIPVYFPDLNVWIILLLMLIVSVVLSGILGYLMYFLIDRHAQKMATTMVTYYNSKLMKFFVHNDRNISNKESNV